MRVTVIGLGYVGLVSAAGFAEWGHEVVGLEIDEGRLDALRAGRVPFYEPGLDELVHKQAAAGRLRFTDDVASAVESSQIVVICVGTHDGSGGWQTKTISDCVASIVPIIPSDGTLVIRSTLPPAFLPVLAEEIATARASVGCPPLPVLINPEFTREGAALHDFLSPDRVVIGVVNDPDQRGVAALGRLYQQVEAPVVMLPAADAVLAKLGSNLFLATKISFANELASLCDAFGGDVTRVVSAMSLDPRIGGAFLKAGVGFGGSCLPHQVSMTILAAREAGIATPLLGAVEGVNRGQRERFVARLSQLLGGPIAGTRIALLGLTFKPATDDLREAPSLVIARILLEEGAEVVGYDPMPSARARSAALVPGLAIAETALGALDGADAAGLLTEWPELVELDWIAARTLMRRPIVVDGRNALVPEVMAAAGYRYAAFGRPAPEMPTPVQAAEHSVAVAVERAPQVPARDLASLRLD